MRPDLQHLVSEPREDLAFEYKTWLDTSEERGKATLAKACIALANHGGGFLVLGFDQQADSLCSVPRPADLPEITQDTINSIIRRYANPEFHCQLHSVTHQTTNVVHPIVAVPSDLTVPVMSRRACEGSIGQHCCYIRKPGPRSEAPQTAEDWRTLLTRCVRANREDMLSAIRSIVLGRADTEPSTPDSEQNFENFRTASFERWRIVTNELSSNSPERFPCGYYEVSVHPIGSTHTESLGELQKRLALARRIKLTGWPPFQEMGREGWKPYPKNDYIEAWIGRRIDEGSPREPHVSDYWRASQSGQLYTIRGYTEDSIKDRKNVEPGTILDVTLPVWRTGEIIFFAARLIAEFEGVESVLINCRFTGLLGRIITSLNWFHRPVQTRPCHTNEVEKHAHVTPQQLEENVVEIIHQLLEPLYEAFDFYRLERALVEEELSRLRRRES